MNLRAFFRLMARGTAVALALAATGVPAGAIVGPSTADAASDVVMILQRMGRSAGFCTAIVVRQDVVLTAAHCAPKGADLRVHPPGDPAEPVMLAVAAVARHPGYRADAVKAREQSIDLALVRLAQPLPDRFQPAVLGRMVSAPVGSSFVASGYGVAAEGEPASSGTLRSTTLSTRDPLSSVLLWASDPHGSGAGACTGDSGGPVRAEGSQEVSALILWAAGAGGRQCGSLTQALWLQPQAAWVTGVIRNWPRP